MHSHRRQALAPPWSVARIGRDANKVVNQGQTGAIPGTSTGPTNWTAPGAGSTLVWTIEGRGQIGPFSYVDHRFAGTGKSGGDQVNLKWAAISAEYYAATPTDVWEHGVFMQLHKGSFTNVTQVSLYSDHFGVSPTFTYLGGNYTGADLLPALQKRAPFTRAPFRESYTVGTASTAWISGWLFIAGTSLAAIDFTLRIAYPYGRKVS